MVLALDIPDLCLPNSILFQEEIVLDRLRRLPIQGSDYA